MPYKLEEEEKKRFIEIDKKLYYKPCVEIHTVDGERHTKHFENDIDAFNYFSYLTNDNKYLRFHE